MLGFAHILFVMLFTSKDICNISELAIKFPLDLVADVFVGHYNRQEMQGILHGAVIPNVESLLIVPLTNLSLS